VSDWLIDKSALVGLAGSTDATEWASRIQRGLVRITTVTRLEVGHAARSGPDLRAGLEQPPLSAMPVEYQTPAIEDRAVEVLSLLADRGQHQAPSIPDLVVAATAELAGLIVLHVDKDFELIASITGQPLERLNLTVAVPEMDADDTVGRLSADEDHRYRFVACGRLPRMAEDLCDRRRLWVIASVAIAGGLLLGPIDLLAQRTVPYPWANLANSSAVWAIGAFGIGVWVRAGRWRPAAAGVVMLLVAVESYFLTATLVQHDNLSNLRTATTLRWLLFGVLAGTLFGTAGAWSRGSNRWLRIVGLALPSAVLLAEAGVLAYRRGNTDAAYRADRLQTAAIEAALGILLAFLLGRSSRERLASLAASLPLAVAGFGALVLAGFG
jgi:predicted nucleic acid-binding protein